MSKTVVARCCSMTRVEAMGLVAEDLGVPGPAAVVMAAAEKVLVVEDWEVREQEEVAVAVEEDLRRPPSESGIFVHEREILIPEELSELRLQLKM